MADTKLIVRNSIALYLRSFLILAITLFASRILLMHIGAENLGVYSAIGGLVSMFAFIQGSMSSATQRFLAYYIGKDNFEDLRKVFSMCVNVHIIISLFLIVIIEIGGLIYINNYFNYGSADLFSTHFIFQTSVASLFFMINSIPYNSLLIARESMKLFTYLEILNKFMQLFAAIVLILFPFEKRLIAYAFFLLLTTIIIRLLYISLCKNRFKETAYVKIWDSQLFRELFSYTGFVTLPAIVSIIKNQGVVLLLNTVFGPIVNAAQGISNQMNSALRQFSNNIGVAFSPQITISYAKNEFNTMNKLFVLGSKISFYLFLIMCIPLTCKIDYILKLWLETPPPYTSTIASLIFLDTLISNMTSCYNTAIRATGNIKHYEILYNSFHLLGMGVIVIFVYMGCDYNLPYILFALFSYISMPIQFYCMKRVLPSVSLSLIWKSILQMSVVGFIAYIVSLFLSSYFADTFLSFICLIMTTFMLNVIIIYFVGLEKNEKQQLVHIINSKIFHK